MSAEKRFKFLVTTDNHLGYKHNDFIRSGDSYSAFAEALQIAREKNVDFILLGGDLFHASRPSPSVEHKCIKILRHHMNANPDRGTSFKRVAGHFSHYEKINHPNFEDPQLTVPYPIMTIHGNHDDLTGPSNQSVCAKLATCGLLNYFGLPKVENEKMIVSPIIVEKDDIKIALYGMGFLADRKLRLAFEKGQVEFKKSPRDAYNILVVHQNRVPYDENKFIPDEMYPNFFHLIIRGHEHDFRKPEPHISSEVDGLVYQPGSTVATSIASKEGGNKFVGLMELKLADAGSKNATIRYKLDYDLIELKSCRKMLFRDITQKEIFKYIKKNCNAAKLTPAEYKHYSRSFVIESIRAILQEHNGAFANSPSQRLTKRARQDQKMLPLVRIRLEYVSKSERFDNSEISPQFYPNEVANPDIILFKKQKLTLTPEGEKVSVTFCGDDAEEDDIDEFDFVDLSTEKRDTIESALEQYFINKPLDERLKVLSLDQYINAIRGTLDDGNVISKVVKMKKQEALHVFYAQLTSEEIAEREFHDVELIERWFLNTFKHDGKPPEKMGGDSMADEVLTSD